SLGQSLRGVNDIPVAATVVMAGNNPTRLHMLAPKRNVAGEPGIAMVSVVKVKVDGGRPCLAAIRRIALNALYVRAIRGVLEEGFNRQIDRVELIPDLVDPVLVLPRVDADDACRRGSILRP